jgi:protein NrfD
MNEIDLIRFNHGIDPEFHIWGWDVSVYLFLGGVTAGIMILTALLGFRRRADEVLPRWVRWMPLAAPALISVGMAALFYDLDYKLHVYRFFLAFVPSSPMSWGSWLLMVVYPATILLGLTGLDDEEIAWISGHEPIRATPLGKVLRWLRDSAAAYRGGLLWTNLLVGVGLGIYTGILLSTLGARPAWSSAILGPLFLVSGLSTGAATMMLFPLGERVHDTLVRWDLIAIVGELILLALYLIGLGSASEASRGAAALFLGGPFTATFWGLVVLTGLVVPLALEVAEIKLHLRTTLAAPLLILAGGAALRFIVVAAGQV